MATAKAEKKSKQQARIEYAALGERLQRLRGARTQREFARMLGIVPSTLLHYEEGTRCPSGALLEKICRDYKISPAWLLLGEGAMYEKEADLPASGDDYIYVPRYSVAASAGHGSIIESEQIVDHLAFKREWLRHEVGAQSVEHLALIAADGDSMVDKIFPDDLLLVDLTQNQIRHDAIYVIRRDSGLQAKRLQLLLDGSVVITSENKAYKEEIISSERSGSLHVVGRVIWIGRRM